MVSPNSCTVSGLLDISRVISLEVERRVTSVTIQDDVGGIAGAAGVTVDVAGSKGT
jgi:hypothetical protein